MTEATKTSRTEEIRAALASAEADLDAARASLGAAVADGDEQATAEARADVAHLEQHTSELRAAIPVAEQRDREAAEREAERRQREEERAANANRKRRIAVARRVDKALAALGRAFEQFEATEPGGTNEDRLVLGRRSALAIRSALAHHALPLARAVGVESVPRPAHRRPLAESESKCIREFDVGDEEEAG